MVVEKPPEVNPPSSRVPRRVLLGILISGSRQRRNSGEKHVTRVLLGVFGEGGIYRQKGGSRGGPT